MNSRGSIYLGVSREAVLLYELEEENFPEHFTDDEGRVSWDAVELEDWVASSDLYDNEGEDEGED